MVLLLLRHRELWGSPAGPSRACTASLFSLRLVSSDLERAGLELDSYAHVEETTTAASTTINATSEISNSTIILVLFVLL